MTAAALPSPEAIADGKARFAARCSFLEREIIVHEHDDCIRIAYLWLNAQKRLQHPNYKLYPLKHIIESWGGRYVSQDDVAVAADLLGLKGRYPRYNIASRHVLPPDSLLDGIGEALKHQWTYRGPSWREHYSRGSG